MRANVGTAFWVATMTACCTLWDRRDVLRAYKLSSNNPLIKNSAGRENSKKPGMTGGPPFGEMAPT